jgi:methionyl-tRNA formyltransferase
VQREAEARAIEVRHPVSLRSASEMERFEQLEADIAVVAAYGLILPQPILDATGRGCVNIHASLLPRWRGAAPIQRAVLAGDAETGVTIMQMEAGLDTGPILAIERTPIDAKTAGELTEELAGIGGRLIVQVLSDLDAYPPTVQPEDGVTYAKKIDKSEARIDFSAPAAQVERQVRGFAPLPGAFFEFESERYKVLAAETGTGGGWPGNVLDDKLTIACGKGTLRPTRIQRAGKPAMSTADLLRGKPIPAGTYLK